MKIQRKFSYSHTRLSLSFLLTASVALQGCTGFSSSNSLGAKSSGLNGSAVSLAAASDAGTAFAAIKAHFWATDNGGHIVPTYNGSPSPVILLNGTQGGNGWRWDRALYTKYIFEQLSLNSGQQPMNMLNSDWSYLKSIYDQNTLSDCSSGSDDAAWEAGASLATYQAIGDPEALTVAQNLVNCVYTYYAGPNNSSTGVWYNSLDQTTSIYEAAVAVAAWDIYKITGDSSYHDRVMQTVGWVESVLGRPDGLYYVEYDPYDNTVYYAGSPNVQGATYLAGDMAMAVLYARLYGESGNDAYRQRAVKIAQGLVKTQTNADGSFMNGRDANTDAEFAVEFVQEVLPLKGMPAGIFTAFTATKAAILANAATPDGYFGADWDGGSSWYDRGYVPQEIYMSVEGAKMILAAAFVNQAAAAAAPTTTTTTTTTTSTSTQNPTTTTSTSTSTSGTTTTASAPPAAAAPTTTTTAAPAAPAAPAAAPEAPIYQYSNGAGINFFSLGANAVTPNLNLVSSTPAFQVFAQGGAGLVPLQRCFQGTALFLSADPSCEGSNVSPLGPIDFIAQSPIAGTVALYRHRSADFSHCTESTNPNVAAAVHEIIGYVPAQ